MSWLLSKQLRPFVLLASAASLVLNLALLVPALYMVQVFDRVFASRSIETLLMLSAFAALALALACAMDALRARSLAKAGAALERRLAPAALTELLHQSAATGGGRGDADVLRDVAQLRSFLASGAVHALFDAPWLPVYVAVIWLMHPLLGWAALAGATVLFVLSVLTERLTRSHAASSQRHMRSASQRAESLRRNAEVIAGMGMLRAALAHWRAVHDKALQAQAALAERTARLGAAARILRQALQVVMLAVGAWLVIGAGASPGIMIATTILLGRALQPVEQLIAGWKMQLDARGAWKRLAERRLSSEPQAVIDEAGSGANARLQLPAPAGRLEVERLIFGHSPLRSPVIKGVHFALEAGTSLGIVGPSAAGKTTLVRVLLGLWRSNSGCVRLDGADIGLWDRDALGAFVGYLPQDVELFAGTVAENIARLGAVDDAQVVAAAQLAHAHEMILRLPQGYDTPIGEGGTLLSGGQRQRIALARALYGVPRLVVLDEPNANLDAEGDEALRAALQTLKARGVTVIIVSHRPALMAQLDQLAVLKDGTLVAFGATATVLPQLIALSAPKQRLAAVSAGQPTGAVA